MLRDQVTQFMESYTRITLSRDAQYQILAKERNLLLHREDQLQQSLADAAELTEVLQEQEHSVEIVNRDKDQHQIEELQEQNHNLME